MVRDGGYAACPEQYLSSRLCRGVSFFLFLFFKLKLKLKPPPKDLLSVLRVAGSRCISKQRLFVQGSQML